MLLIYKEYSTNLTTNYTCDNDNWEMKRVTNAIAETFNTTDNANNFSFLYTAVKHKINFVEATLEVVFHALYADADLENLSIDSTSIKAHPHSVGAKKGL